MTTRLLRRTNHVCLIDTFECVVFGNRRLIVFDVHRHRHVVPWEDARQHGLLSHLQGFDKFLEWLCLSPDRGQDLSRQQEKREELMVQLRMAQIEVNRTKALLAQQGINS